MKLLSQMEKRGLNPDVISYSAAISSCRKGYQWEKALQLLAQMESRKIKPDLVTYGAAISACEKGHQWKCAVLKFSFSFATLNFFFFSCEQMQYFPLHLTLPPSRGENRGLIEQ